MRESAVELWLRKALNGCLYYKFVSPGNAGVPDRIVVAPGGRIYFVELKAEDGVLSALQRHQLDRLRERGADARCIRGMAQARAFAAEVLGRGGF
jgi:hypothetical protein